MSWLTSLLSAIGSGAGTAIDELDLLAQGFGEETMNPNYRPEYDRGLAARASLLESGLDPSSYEDSPEEGAQLAASIIDAPLRAIDRASKYYTGEELIADRPYMNVPGQGRASRLPPRSAPAVDLGGEQESSGKRLMSKRAQQLSANEAEAQMALDSLRRQSSPDTALFASRGDTTFGSNAGPLGGGSFSRSLPTVVKQDQLRVLGKLGIAPDVASIMLKNADGEEARNAILGLTARRMVPMQEQVAGVLQGARDAAAKAVNPNEVIKYTVSQLRNLGLSDPQIKMLMMSMAPGQAS